MPWAGDLAKTRHPRGQLRKRHRAAPLARQGLSFPADSGPAPSEAPAPSWRGRSYGLEVPIQIFLQPMRPSGPRQSPTRIRFFCLSWRVHAVRVRTADRPGPKVHAKVFLLVQGYAVRPAAGRPELAVC